MAELSEQDKALLREVFKPAIRARLLEDDLAGATDLKRLEIRILYPMPEIDWAATAAGRRVAARDRSWPAASQ